MTSDAYLRPIGSPNNKTIYHGAVEFLAIDCLQFLLMKNRKKTHLTEPDSNGNPPLHFLYNFLKTRCKSYRDDALTGIQNDCKPIREGVLSVLSMLIDEGVDVNACDNDGNTFLHKLVRFEEIVEKDVALNLVEILLKHPNINYKAKNGLGLDISEIVKRRSLLELVGVAKLQEIIEKLDSKTSKNSTEFETSIAESFLMKDIEQMKVILQGMEGSIIDTEMKQFVGSKTLLYHVSSNLDHDAVQVLLSRCHDPWVTNADDGKLPIHAALSRGHYKTVKLLIQSMKQKTHNGILDFRKISFSLFQKLFCNFQNAASDDSNINYMECLESILTDDILINIHQSNKSNVKALDLIDWLRLEDVRQSMSYCFNFETLHTSAEKGWWYLINSILINICNFYKTIIRV